MTKILILLAFVSSWLVSSGQILAPVKWSYAAKRTGKNEVVLFLKATIESGWHIYSTKQKDGGPQKTSFEFDESKDYILTGTVIEPQPMEKYERVFEMDVFYFSKSVVFSQKVKLKRRTTIVKGKVSFMTCTNLECLPPDEVQFSIPIN